jgi:hypothetical protein
MTLTYQEEQFLKAASGRDAILNLNARHNRAYSDGDREHWITTFRHAGATFVRDGELFTDVRLGFDGGDAQRMVTVDHEIAIDGVNAMQRCVALLFTSSFGDTTLRATGTYRDELIYERGGWYFTSRNLTWDVVPSRHPLVM